MPSNLRHRIEQSDLPPALNGLASRRLPLRVLFAHTDIVAVERCMQELRNAHLNVSADIAPTPEEFSGRLKSKYYDVVIAEHPARNWAGPDALEILRRSGPRIPCIYLSDTTELETVAELITEGAADCIGIDHVGHLPVSIRRALSENNLRQERDQTEKKLRHSEARYRALVGNLAYGMCRCSMRGQFLHVNQALVTMLGYASREELLAANHASEILCDSAKRAQLLGHSTGQDGAGSLEIEWKRKNGTTLKVRLSGREVGDDGEMGSYEIIVEDLTQQRTLEDHLRQQAAEDPLTGLANYRHLVETVNAEIQRSARTARQFALLFLDLDGLKQINDRFGHLVGSAAICRLADVLSICSRKIDTPARFGGDEFALVLPETGKIPASLVARRIRESLANDGKEPRLSVSIGVATYPGDGRKIEPLLAAADAALYAMKASTRSPVRHEKKAAKPSYEVIAPERDCDRINMPCGSAFRLNPAMTSEEAMVMRALSEGRTYTEVCKRLRMSAAAFSRTMSNMRDKTGTVDNTSLAAWAKRQIKDADQRIDRHERHARLA
jgi:diguanylate cyclase (GGDEF)-like protein/PAS domain S-box-containing protein